MANLTITIGALNASVSADNAKASALLSQYAEAIGAHGTNQQRADAVVQSLVRHMQHEARRHRSNQAQAEGIAAAQQEIDGLGWTT
jgi:hypothetical protein